MKKIAVAGFGFMGVTHAQNILKNPGLDLCGIIETRKGDIFAGLGKTGNQGGVSVPLDRLKTVPVFASLEDCVKTAKPDAVSICLPLYLHYEAAKKALSLGLDVLLEKPFCPEPEQCAELIELADRKGLILMVAHCVRFSPQWDYLAQCVKDGRHGRPRFISTSRIGGEPGWGVWLDPKIKKTCGGALLDLLIHDIDFANYCFGAPPDAGLSFRQDDYWEIALAYPGADAKVSVKGGFLPRNSMFMAEYAASFERAGVRHCGLQPDAVHIGTEKGAETLSLSGDLYNEEMCYFADIIEKRAKPLRCPPEESMLAVKICRNIRESAGR
jgi:predicted dehydrogenase